MGSTVSTIATNLKLVRSGTDNRGCSRTTQSLPEADSPDPAGSLKSVNILNQVVLPGTSQESMP